jgi:uncharacterized paraquat-inducible protein A
MQIPVPSTLFMNPPPFQPEERSSMKCPRCRKSISLFSPAIMGPTKPGGARLCPHCGEKFAITTDPKMAALAAVGAAVIGFFVMRPIPYIGIGLWGAGAVAAIFTFAARLKKFES